MQNGIRFENVSFSYPDKTEVLSGINFTIEPGSFVGVTGTNGSGKSTCTYLMNGLIPHTIPGRLTGDVFVDGVNTRTKPVAFFAKHVGMVFQNPDFSLFNLTVAQEIAFGLTNLHRSADATLINNALSQVGLDDFRDRDPQSLSFGEKQKVCLACVLSLDVSYIILDEPTAMLDYKSSVELYRLLRVLNKKGKTIIAIEHDTDFLWNYTSQMILIDHGKIHSIGKTKAVLTQDTLLSDLGIKKPNTIRHE